MSVNNRISNTNNGVLPRVGMLANIRKRRGIITSVEPYDAKPEGRIHLVRVEYTDTEGTSEDIVIWEREHGATLLEPTALPRVGDEPAMPAADFDALVRAVRWSAITPFLNTDGSGTVSTLPIASPFFGAVQVEDFQLIPLLKALQMPRISLLLADDVGLGKTIEAGLILTELLIRRRIRRVLILCPASLRHQWQQEMREKFALTFDLIDRQETHALQKRLGLDANPWRIFPRIISSYHYLRQPDILEQFSAACRQPEGSSQLPWDMLIVDEAHNLMPSNFGEDSDLSRMLRIISPWFEHKLFLTATPHNGHTRCFSGLLEQLDPVRFTQTNEFTQQERTRVEDIVVRRLKREINELDDTLKRPRRFAERYLEPIPLYFHPTEKTLSLAFQEFHKGVKSAIASAEKIDQIAGIFAVEVLNKRLLSCPSTFAESWYRFKQGLHEEEPANVSEVKAAQRASEEEIDDDRERQGRARHAARTVGAWLKPLAYKLKKEIDALDFALARLGIQPADDGQSNPVEDARLDRLINLVKKQLRQGDKWAQDERLIVFTEYKTTLDYIEKCLQEAFKDKRQAIRVLYGGMDQVDRDEIKEAFNNPSDPVRILIATDAASEGLNLQETARLLLHYEIPWNPSRLEQRNGRLDRHGQARDVSVYHFTSEDDADLKFLAHVVKKVDTIREDLGSMGEVFDAAFQRRFVDMEDIDRITKELDTDLEQRKGRASIPRQLTRQLGTDEANRLSALCREIDLSPETLCQTLETALGIGYGQPRLEGPDQRGRMRLKLPLPPRWELLIDDTLRIKAKGRDLGPLPAIIFDPELFIQRDSGRPVFRPAKDTVLLHLGHPMFRQALAVFARARFPGGHDQIAVSRWTVRYGGVPAGVDALLLLTVEELAVNELREPFHHWVRTLRLPVKNGELGIPLPNLPAADDRPASSRVDEKVIRRAEEIWEEVSFDLTPFLNRFSQELTESVRSQLESVGKRSQEEEKKRFKDRLSEVERAMRETSLKKLERERDELLEDLRQGKLFAEIIREKEIVLRNLEDEMERRRNHYQELLEMLKKDETRVIEQMLPRRYTLRGQVQVFPIAVEIRLPEVGR
jgi:superfamily II DNA or RNA helicase